jgi:hypothetical protein
VAKRPDLCAPAGSAPCRQRGSETDTSWRPAEALRSQPGRWLDRLRRPPFVQGVLGFSVPASLVFSDSGCALSKCLLHRSAVVRGASKPADPPGRGTPLAAAVRTQDRLAKQPTFRRRQSAGKQRPADCAASPKGRPGLGRGHRCGFSSYDNQPAPACMLVAKSAIEDDWGGRNQPPCRCSRIGRWGHCSSFSCLYPPDG